MNIGKVVGTVVATRKDETLVGSKLMVTQPLDLCGNPEGAAKVMVDTVGAGTGELVLYVAGTAARNAAGQKAGAIDSAIVAIIDSLEVDPAFRKAAPCGKEGEEHIE